MRLGERGSKHGFPGPGVSALLPAAVWLASFGLFLKGLAPGVALEDCSELAACAATLSNTHSPGYALHVMAARVFACLPAGSIAFRLNLLSAACGAASVLALFLLVRLLCSAAGLGKPAAVWGAVSASSFLALLPVFRWLSSIGEKYSLFVALFTWSCCAFARFGLERKRRWAYAGAFLAGLAMADHYQGVYLAIPLAWILFKLGGSRARTTAVFLAMLAPAARVLYSPLRATAGFPSSWGVTDRFPALLSYLGFSDYSQLFFGRAPGGPLDFVLAQAGLLARALGVVGREANLLLLLAAPGAVLLWRAVPWAGRGALLMVGLNLILSSSYNAAQAAKFDLPLLMIIAGLAGAGIGWLAAKWKPAPAVAVLLSAVFLVRGSPSAMRDRDFLATDHLRNLLLAVPPGSFVVGFNETWLFLPWYATVVEPGGGLKVLWDGYLVYDNPQRRRLEKFLGPRADRLRWHQEGSALFREIAGAVAPAGVFLEYVGVPVPSRGASWRGLVLKLEASGEARPFDETSWRVDRALRLRSLLRPAGAWGNMLAGWVAEGLAAQSRAALEAGERGRAVRLLALAKRLRPDLPELGALAGKLALAGGDAAGAEAEWKRALELARGDSVPALLGLAEISARRGETPESLKFLRSAAAAGADAAAARMAGEGDAAGKWGRADRAAAFYRKAAALALDAAGVKLLAELRLLQAAQAWNDALKVDPGCGAAFRHLGALAFFEGRFEDAKREEGRALAADPGDGEARQALDQAQEALDWTARLPRFERALESGQAGPGTLCDAGNAFLKAGRVKVAEVCYRRAARLDSRSARAWNNLGVVLARQDRTGEAILAYRKAAAVDPRYTDAMLNLATALIQSGDQRGAAAWIRKVLKLEPGNGRARALERLAGGGGT